jgi:predicted transposase/invertase (TIGR01784 family)
MLGTQLFVGEQYTEMKKVISVVILDYNLIEDNDCFHNTYRFYDAKTQSLFTDICEIHTLELKKLCQAIHNINATDERDEKSEKLILWLSLINACNEEEINMLATKDPYIKEACRVLDGLSDSEEVRLLYESREKAIRDEQARLYAARKDGMEEGLTNAAKAMRSKGFSIEMIRECTGLTEGVILSL